MGSDWTNEELDHLRISYAAGPTVELAAQMGRTENAIRIKANKLGLNKPRVRILHSDLYWTTADIKVLHDLYPTVPTKQLARQLGRTAKSIGLKAHKLGIAKIGHPGFTFPDHLRRYTLADNLFQELTPATAYILGFILADGCIKSGGYRLTIANTDYEILDKIRREMQSTHPITEQHKGTHTCWDLGVSHKATVSNLIARGITPRKSLTAVLPDVPDHLFSHFVRGYFDGDGAVHYGHNGGLRIKFTSGSLVLLKQISDRLRLLFDLPERTINHDKGQPFAGRLYYSGPTAARLGRIMYTDAGDLYISRKHQVFNTYADHHYTHMPTNEA